MFTTILSSVTSMVFGWKEKLIAASLAILAFLGWIMKIKHDARKEGAKAVQKQVEDNNKQVEDDWKKIDDAPLDVDTAIERLRKRTAGH